MADELTPSLQSDPAEHIGRFRLLGKLGEGGMGVVFLGHDAELERKIAIKLMRTDIAGRVGVRRLVREAQGLARLSHPNVIQVHEIGVHQSSLFVAMEYVDGCTLRDWLDVGGRSWRETLDILRQSGRGLEAAHAAGLIHRDFKPGNVMVGNDGRARVLDFGLARDNRSSTDTAGPFDSPDDIDDLGGTLEDTDSDLGSLTRSGAVVGTPAYMAPEQMYGQSNGPLSDQFSFCVTAYEALFGRRPFAGSTLAELATNIAGRRFEPPPNDSPVPERVREAVLRGLAVNPGARWPTMAALLDELDAVVTMVELQAYLERMRAEQSFEPTDRLRPDQFEIPEQLYGRDAQLKVLTHAFERSGQPTSARLVLVSGLAGIGKSSLVEGLRPSVETRGGWMFAGKFDQQSTTPRSGLSQALTDLVAHVEREQPNDRARLCQAIGEALGRGAPLVCDLVPAVARLLGSRAPANELGANERPERRPPVERFTTPHSSPERLNRLHNAVVRLLAALVGPDRPLVMVVDDLQWADAASLALLEQLLTSPELRGLLVVGLCRSNEIGPGHPLRATVERVRKAGSIVSPIELDALSRTDIETLLADTLRCDPPTVRELAGLALIKTDGNPLFLRQLLQTIYDQGLVRFDRATGRWRWDLDQIARNSVFDDIGRVLLRNLETLPPASLQLVQIAACVGYRVDLLVLAAVAGRDPVAMLADLRPTFERGLLLIEGGLLDQTREGVALGDGVTLTTEIGALAMRFRHSRIQQAALGSLTEGQRMRAHLEIGRLLRRRFADAPPGVHEFEIADQLNAALPLLDDDEREPLSVLNFGCGRRALDSGAYSSAVHYLELAAELLAEDAARRRHALWFAIELERGRALTLEGGYAEASSCYQMLLHAAETDGERMLVHAAQVEHALLIADYESGYAACRRGFTLQGIELPADDDDAHAMFVAELDALEQNLGGRSPAQVFDRPELDEALLQPSPDLLHGLGALSYVSARPNINGWIIARIVNISLRSGNSKASTVAYARIALHLAERGDYERARAFGELARSLCERYDDPATTGRAYVAYFGHAAYYNHPLRNIVPHFVFAFEKCLEGGDLHYAGHQLLFSQYFLLIAGAPLAKILAEIEQHLPFLRRSVPNSLAALHVPYAVLLTCTLMDVPLAQLELEFDHANHLASFGGSMFAIAWYWSAMTKLDYLLGRRIDTDELLRRVHAVEIGLPGNLLIREIRYYATLSLLQQLRDRAQPLIAGWRADLARCADRCPANFRHKHLLVEAELIHATNGPLEQALDLYEQAIGDARDNAVLDQEALACWRFAEFWRERGSKRTAQVYLAAAREIYQSWGARRLVRELDARYSEPLGGATPS